MRDEEEKHPSRSESQVPGDVEKLFSRLNLEHSQYQRFGLHRVNTQLDDATLQEAPVTEPQQTDVPPPLPAAVPLELSEQKTFSIGFYSPMGGSGKSLLAASIGALLCRMGRRVLLVDTSPWHTLATHFGATEPKAGTRIFHVPDGGGAGVQVLHCDAVSPPNLSDLTAIDCVILDLGDVSEQTASEWLKRCDRVIVPLVPTAQAPIMAYMTREKIETLGFEADRLLFVLNLMDRTPASNRVRMLLGELLHEQLLPEGIERQVVVDEALSEGIVLPYFAPDSQVAKVSQEIIGRLQIPESAQKKTARRWLEG